MPSSNPCATTLGTTTVQVACDWVCVLLRGSVRWHHELRKPSLDSPRYMMNHDYQWGSWIRRIFTILLVCLYIYYVYIYIYYVYIYILCVYIYIYIYNWQPQDIIRELPLLVLLQIRSCMIMQPQQSAKSPLKSATRMGHGQSRHADPDVHAHGLPTSTR